jgi:AraC-like DNA-binding protein
MSFHTIYFTVLIVGFIFFYTVKHRNNQNKFHLNYLILFFASLLVATSIYSICVYKKTAVNFSVIFYFIVLHLIFFYKYLELFLNQKRKKSMYLYAPIIIFAIMSTYELSGYNLNDLALEIKITPKRVISLINSFESLTVNDFLNKHRIEFAKEKISEGYLSRFSIEALYLESGFKSAQTFCRTFKKFEGIPLKNTQIL